MLKCAAMAICSLAITSCSRPADTDPQSQPARAPVPVVVSQAVTRDVPVEIYAVGNVQPFSLVTVKPQITGRILDVHFREGQDVEAGDLLVTLDPSPWQAALDQAQANLNRDEAQLLNARLEFQRASNLFANRIASEREYQSAEANFLFALGTVQADAAALTNALVSLAYTKIKAPLAGRTGVLQVKAGNVVKAPDDAIVTITQNRPAYVAFAVPEQHLSAVRREAAKRDLPVRAFAPGETNTEARGKLTFIDNSVNISTGTILLKGTFPNEDLVLWPGQFVQTVLTLSNIVAATTLPSYAVQNGQAGEFVFVVRSDETVEMRPVQTGVRYQGATVILSGVEPGETVVTDGHLRLTPNAKVSVKQFEAETSASNRSSARP